MNDKQAPADYINAWLKMQKGGLLFGLTPRYKATEQTFKNNYGISLYRCPRYFVRHKTWWYLVYVYDVVINLETNKEQTIESAVYTPLMRVDFDYHGTEAWSFFRSDISTPWDNSGVLN